MGAAVNPLSAFADCSSDAAAGHLAWIAKAGASTSRVRFRVSTGFTSAYGALKLSRVFQGRVDAASLLWGSLSSVWQRTGFSETRRRITLCQLTN